MPYYRITGKGLEKYENFWSDPHVRRTWSFTKDEQIESGLLEKLWESGIENPLWIVGIRDEGRVLRSLEKKGLVRKVEKD